MWAAAESPPAEMAGEGAVAHGNDAVDYDVLHPVGVLVGLFVSGVIFDGRRVEHHDVGGGAGYKPATAA
ncbi:hypothetical protein CVCC1112_3129 [Paenarthrobacter nicotinovorans]|nr:hypothetical protein CVCC1112_3129 [Paenarthrobacter nicotinovorans]